MLLELGDPIGPEMILPPFALARSVDKLDIGTDAPPLTALLRLDGMFADELRSFLGIV